MRNLLPREGLEGSAQGFNPWAPSNKTVRPERVRGFGMNPLRHMTIALSVRVVSPLYLAPLSGRVALGGRFPELKPWAESSSPFGAIFRFAC
jgi:hypothetical protein